jgi:leader peptidase (prepilin peptidase)/N-methyltransferase
VNAILAIPFELRLGILFVLGAALGGWLNLAIYRLAWNPRAISPWMMGPAGAAPRTRGDRLPLVGWWFLRREESFHGRGFWIRPLLLELVFGLSVATLYWWEVAKLGLQLPPVVGLVPPGAFVNDNLSSILHVQFLSHVVLLSLMVVASLIDIDEMIIPDTITIPGTLLGLTFATLAPWSLLPGNCWLPPNKVTSLREFLTMVTPDQWPPSLVGAPHLASLAIALACWWGWCFAIMPRRWMTRRGLSMALRVLVARLWREPHTWRVFGMGVVGSLVIGGVWKWGADVTWAAMLTSLVGLVGGGGLVWLVRIIGSYAVGREAMGFGDVTLMAMVGTFIGWQASLIAFLLAPLAGLFVGVTKWIFYRDRELPFGPYLCLGTAFVVVCWAEVWQAVSPYFAMGWLVPTVVAICLVAMGIMLAAWRLVLGIFVR